MATTYKAFLNNDIVSTRTLLHEAIPLTGSIVSGTYAPAFPNGGNIKNFAHGMFQSIYDYPYLSSSANQIFDLSVGISHQSQLSSSTTVQRPKKINLYSQMAQVLMGYDATGSIERFDQDGVLAGGTKINDCFFINFARLLAKDEVKKGSFTLKLGVGQTHAGAMGTMLTITDAGAATSYKVNSPAGEYGILSCSAGGGFVSGQGSGGNVGLIFYQAGVAVLSSSVFLGPQGGGVISDENALMFAAESAEPNSSFSGSLTGSTIQASCDAIRHRLYDLSFNNTTELNSTIHFCRVNNNDYNYSANPTYLSSSKIVVKNNTLDAPVSYITAVGLYSADNELLAVAKLSEPLKKDPTNEMTIRVRLDY
tara:strand:- start:988 stop:2085 length:1098 start_codon:yes stop_codon:yes gene_type:complete